MTEGLTEEAVRQIAIEVTGQTTGPGTVLEPDGTPNPYASRIRDRQAADTFYLVMQSYFGHAQAVEMTCEAHGHDARGGRCERCGRGITGAEARLARERAGRQGVQRRPGD